MLWTWIGTLWSDESGQDLAEYAILLALIAIVVIASIMLLGPQIAAVFDAITAALTAVG